jgi:hypothetical protein
MQQYATGNVIHLFPDHVDEDDVEAFHIPDDIRYGGAGPDLRFVEEKPAQPTALDADILLVRQTPALIAYLDRIGAKIKNFRRFAVEGRDDGGYPGTITEVSTRDGALKVVKLGDPAHAPTAGEKEAIEAELAKATFPRPEPRRARPGNRPPQVTGADPKDVFYFLDRKGECWLFVQRRIDGKDGEKDYLPYSYWSDGHWRSMEPDLLPLWGLDQLDRHTDVMVHEGAKAAREARAIVEEGRPHPWRVELEYHAHLGWPGGVRSHGRVDWSPLIRHRPRYARMVLALDNDSGGKNAARPISKLLARSLLALKYDDRFPQKFDLGDEWPKKLRQDRFRDFSLETCLFPITYATREVAPKSPEDEGKKQKKSDKTYHVIHEHFADEWYWIKEVDAFVHKRQPDRIKSHKLFNQEVFSDVKDTARLMTNVYSTHVDGLAYRPGDVRGVINDRSTLGRSLLNTWTPSVIRPVKGNPDPYVDFMKYLIPDERERYETERWGVTLVVTPETQMCYSELLISATQGIGKSTWALIVAKLVGLLNVSFPTENDIINAAFNDWAAHKLPAVVQEIYGGENRKVYNTLKDKIADRSTPIRINRKFLQPYNVENWLHVIASSNYDQAMYLPDEDRRWLVPRLTEKLLDKEYWTKFYAWLEADGYGVIRYYFDELAKKQGLLVSTAERAPETSRKLEVIHESRSQGQKLAHELALIAKEQPGRIVLAVEGVRDWVTDELTKGGRLPNGYKPDSADRIKKAMKAAGLTEPERGQGDPRLVVDIGLAGIANRVRTFLVANFPIPADTKWEDLVKHYKRPGELWPI